MSSVVRRSLPRPTIINAAMFGGASNTAEQLINHQMFALIAHDNKKYPARGMKPKYLPKEAPQMREFSLS